MDWIKQILRSFFSIHCSNDRQTMEWCFQLGSILMFPKLQLFLYGLSLGWLRNTLPSIYQGFLALTGHWIQYLKAPVCRESLSVRMPPLAKKSWTNNNHVYMSIRDRHRLPFKPQRAESKLPFPELPFPRFLCRPSYPSQQPGPPRYHPSESPKAYLHKVVLAKM